MTKGPSKSIVGNFGKFLAGEPPAATRPTRVGAGVIGAAERSIAQIVEERDRLQALVSSGRGGTVTINPELVDPSPFRDRLPDDDDAAFEAFKRRFAEEGQKVPVQLRAHPQIEGRFQVVYGRRRVRAAKELEKSIDALIVDMSDRDLMIAQGIENSERQDLSWIERALFAWRMESEGNVKARDIRAALSVEDPELAHMRSVMRALPVDVVETIGRAPKVGRPRWLTLARSVVERNGALGLVRETLADAKVSELSSNERFQRALAAVQKREAPASEELHLVAANGRPIAKAVFSGKDVHLVIDRARSAAFGAFLKAELPVLIERFDAGADDTDPRDGD